MSVWFWIAAAWLAATLLTTLAVFGAKRSRRIRTLLFGERPTGEVRRITAPRSKPAPAVISRRAA